MSRINISVFLILFFCLFSCHTASANDIYHWQDNEGRWHFSDTSTSVDAKHLTLSQSAIEVGSDRQLLDKNKKYFAKRFRQYEKNKPQRKKVKKLRKRSLSPCQKLHNKISDKRIQLKLHKREGMKHTLEKKEKRKIKALEIKLDEQC